MSALIKRIIRVSQILTYRTFNTKNVKLRTFSVRAIPFVTDFFVMNDYTVESVEHMTHQVVLCESATLLFQLATILYNVSVPKSFENLDQIQNE